MLCLSLHMDNFLEVLSPSALLDLCFCCYCCDLASLDSSFGVYFSLPLYCRITRWTGRSLTLLDPTYATKYIPIIASVSEHQPTTWTTFFLDLQIMVPLAPVGIYLLFKEMSDANIFLILYGTISWYFAGMFACTNVTFRNHDSIDAHISSNCLHSCCWRILCSYSSFHGISSVSWSGSGNKRWEEELE